VTKGILSRVEEITGKSIQFMKVNIWLGSDKLPDSIGTFSAHLAPKCRFAMLKSNESQKKVMWPILRKSYRLPNFVSPHEMLDRQHCLANSLQFLQPGS